MKYILLKAVKINNTNINKSIFAPENNKKEDGFKIANTKTIKLKQPWILNILNIKYIAKKINK